MPSSNWTLFRSSIIRKQIVAVTGLAMVGFLVAHLSGNFLIFAGPEAFNGYSEKLHHLGPILWILRIGMIVAVVAHVFLAVGLTRENRAARGGRYEVDSRKGDAGFAKQTMIYTGLLLLVFIVLHLYDFTFRPKTGDPTVIAGVNGGESLGLFGLVWNSFLQPWHSGLYIVAMVLLGLHLSHGIQSFFQTFGISHDRYTPLIDRVSLILGIGLAVGFLTIPIYIFIVRTPHL